MGEVGGEVGHKISYVFVGWEVWAHEDAAILYYV